MRPRGQRAYGYDICLSFAGEQRAYVERVAAGLRALGINVFYDRYERASLWGKDLYQHLDFIYREAAFLCVLFISKEYAQKAWTGHELRSAQARALNENKEYILPARFDETDIPGLPSTIGYVDLRHMEPDELANLIAEKLELIVQQSGGDQHINLHHKATPLEDGEWIDSGSVAYGSAVLDSPLDLLSLEQPASDLNPFAEIDRLEPATMPAEYTGFLPSSYASWTQRAAAGLIDILPALTAALVTSFADLTAWQYVLIWIAFCCYTIVNRWVFGGFGGQTVGRRLLAIMLISEETGYQIGSLNAFIRDICHIMDFVVLGLGYLFPLWDLKRQTLADKIMRTVVINCQAVRSQHGGP